VAIKANMEFVAFMWSSLAAVVHIVAATAWHTSRTMQAVRMKPRNSRAHSRSLLARVRPGLMREITICAAHPRRNYLLHEKPERPITLFCNRGASFMGIVLLIFGTATLASSLFTGALDALTVIVRYILSATCYQLILMFELEGLVAVETDRSVDTPGVEKETVLPTTK
jgi:hypothetical protein